LSSDVAPLATHGWPEYTSIYQPSFEKELDIAARAVPGVELFHGETARAVKQDANSITVTTENRDGKARSFEARYLVGADGGNSFIRGALGIAYEDLGFDQNWLVIDAKAIKPRPGLPAMRQLCEPEQPGVTLYMGPNHRRWSFMIFADESPEDAVKPESVWSRLDRPEGGTPEEFELIRVASYKFQSLYAERWRVGRAFLAGDSAHQMPPFLAQGLCSGFRDAHNLAWKLSLVLRGKADDRFLDTYESERGPSARATIVESMRVGLHVNERDPEKVKIRDDQLRAMQAAKANQKLEEKLIAFRVPGFAKGFVASGTQGAGDAFPQAKIRGEREGQFDDVAGRGFIILARGSDPLAALSDSDRDFWKALDGKVVKLGDGGFADSEGRYSKLMDEYKSDIIVKRPDFYIFGTCRNAQGLPALLGELRRQLDAG